MPSTVGADLEDAFQHLQEAHKKLLHATNFNAETDDECATQEAILMWANRVHKVMDEMIPPQDAWPKGKAEIVDLETHRRRKRGG